MKLKYTFLLLLPTFLLASEEGGTDIIERTINFSIFAAILYYLIADKAKAFFTGRTKDIADRLSSLESKVQETKVLKSEAVASVDSAKRSSVEIIELAHKEVEMQSAKLKDIFEHDVAYLEKSYEDKKEILQKKMTEEVVSEVINDLFADGGVSLGDDELVNIINKKVA